MSSARTLTAVGESGYGQATFGTDSPAETLRRVRASYLSERVFLYLRHHLWSDVLGPSKGVPFTRTVERLFGLSPGTSGRQAFDRAWLRQIYGGQP